MVEKVLNLMDLQDVENDLALQAFELYEISFPIQERVPLDHLKEDIQRRAKGERSNRCIRHFWIAVEGRRVIGLSIYSYFKEPRLALLDYLATQPDLRGRGLGGRLLERTVELLSADARALEGKPARGMCWEVERPEDGATSQEQVLRERRIDFYKRHGACVLDRIRYTAPPLDEGLPAVPYSLMFMPGPGQTNLIDKALERAVIEIALIDGYGLDREAIYYKDAITSILN